MITSRSHKICRPLVHHHVLRTQLLEQLANTSTMPVIAVLAPPGYGKTTFVSSYIESVACDDSIWYCVDEGDADLASFFHYFSRAVREATAKRRKTIPQYQAEDAMNVKGFARRYFSQVYQRLEPPFYLVFDDIHECQSPAWADVIRVAVDELPAAGRIILIGRQALPPAFARLNINQKIRTFREQDLRFNDEELIQLASMHNINTLSAEQCHKVQAMMAGWGAGLMLLFTRMKQFDERALLEFDTKQELYSYFMNEVLRCLDEPTHEVLYRTCFLPDVPVEYAIELTKNSAAGNLLQDLYDRNYFTYRISDTATVYRYHPLFKAFLMAQSEKKLSAQSVREIQQTSVTLLENDGAIIAAASLLVDMGDGTRLAELTLQYAPQLVAENYTQTLFKWLQHIPSSVIDDMGWLLFWRGVCVVFMRPQIARQDFVSAFKHFTALSDATGQCLSLSGIIDSYMFERDDFTFLDPWIEQVDRLHSSFDQQVSPPALVKLTLSMFDALMHRAPDHFEFDLWLERIIKIPINELPPSLQVRKQVAVILYYLWQGDFRHVEINHHLLEKQLKHNSGPVSEILWHIIDCAFLWSTGDGQRGLMVAKNGLKKIKAYGLESLWNISLITHGTAAALIVHDSEQASRLLDNAAGYVAESGRIHLCLYHILYAIHSFRSGTISAASYHAQEAHHCAEASGLPFFQAYAYFIQAQLCFVHGDMEQARQYTLTSKRIGCAMRSYFHQCQAQLFEAILDRSVGQHQSALALLTNALRLAEQYNMLPGLWVCEDELTQILVEAMRHDVESVVARRIIHKRHLMPTDPPYDITAWPWPIRIHTLGCFDIVIDDQPFELPSRNRPKLFAFLQTLIAFGGKQVREEVISEAVWPDAEGDAAHQLFDTTLFRLRKLLGVPEAIINRGGKVSLNKRVCWLDTWALNVGIDQLTLFVKENPTSVDQIKKSYDQLQDYYRGDFLQAEEDFPIVTQHRQQLRAKWQRILYLMANYWLQQNDSIEAEACLEKLLKLNPLEEQAYCMLMKLHIAHGEFSKTAVVYEACKKALQAGLDVQPSAATEQIFNEVRD